MVRIQSRLPIKACQIMHLPLICHYVDKLTGQRVDKNPVQIMSAPTAPAVRYHGSKWRLFPWLSQFIPDHRIYVEPFGGGASGLLQKPRAQSEVYNDLDDDIVNFFRVLRDPEKAAELCQQLELTRAGFCNDLRIGCGVNHQIILNSSRSQSSEQADLHSVDIHQPAYTMYRHPNCWN